MSGTLNNLVHYASAPVKIQPRTHEQKDDSKPEGLWVSVGSEWLDWCRSEEFRTDVAWYEHAVAVSPEANILVLSSPEEIDAFTLKYRTAKVEGWTPYYIDWPRVAADFDGIVIDPYQWSRRNTRHTFWYYGWDVASGCIWNSDVVSIGAPVEIPSHPAREYGGINVGIAIVAACVGLFLWGWTHGSSRPNGAWVAAVAVVGALVLLLATGVTAYRRRERADAAYTKAMEKRLKDEQSAVQSLADLLRSLLIRSVGRQ